MQIEVVVPYNDERVLREVFLQSKDLDRAKLVLVENGRSPIGLPVLFNTHKRNSAADWIIFCHQDFVVHENGWLDRILASEPAACYGPIGPDMRGNFQGQIRQTNGSLLGKPASMAEVSTLDEMCIIIPRRVYSEVDFDEQFSFHFYACDYCLQANKLGYPSRIIQLDCEHKSRTLTGDIFSEGYLNAKLLFLNKYKDVKPLVTTTFQLWPRYEWLAELELKGYSQQFEHLTQLGRLQVEAGRTFEGQASLLEAGRVLTIIRERIENHVNDLATTRFWCHRLVGHYSHLGEIHVRAGCLAEARASLIEAIRLSLQKRTNAKMFVRSLRRLVRSYLPI